MATPFLESRGIDLIELRVTGNDRRRFVRVYVDCAGGVNIDGCAELSRGLEDILDVHDPIGGAYVLEVSTPGLDRALESSRDYQWALGKPVRLYVQNRGTLTGSLVSFDDEYLILQTECEAVHVPRSDVKKAHLHFSF